MPSTIDPELLALQQRVVGRYSIERELGRGGMGIVVLARDVALERPVAIKLLPSHFAVDERMRSRFVAEAQTAARLSHPNIVPIHSVEEHDEVVFFVMGFIDGETLAARVRRTGPLNASDGSRLVQELAWALAYAHSAGVIHRDVKPDNVLIERTTGRALLTDFGIAHLTDRSPRPGEIVGTAQFVSPEQASGSPIDGRSDLYSLGVTAFFALTGRLPFESHSTVGLLGMHLTQPAPPLESVRGSLPPRLCTAIDRCLAKDPANRFETGERLAEAIADTRDAEVQVAPPVRAFLRDRTRMAQELGLLYIAATYLGAFSHVPLGKIVLPLGALAVASAVRVVRAARRLLTDGYDFDDVCSAISVDSAARHEELGITPLAPAAESYLRTAALQQAFGLVAAGMGAMAVVAGLSDASAIKLVSGGAAVILGLGLLYRAGPMPPKPRRQRLWSGWFDQLWRGRLGGWFFALAGIGARSPGPRARASDAPTEVLLVRSAADLFDALPPALRAELEPGRKIIEHIHAHIGRLHEREASADRSAAIAALENIRLQLLRLHAGLASPADVTRNLEAARELERRISAILEVEDIAPRSRAAANLSDEAVHDGATSLG